MPVASTPPWRLTFRLAVWAALLLFMALANSAVEVMDGSGAATPWRSGSR